MKAKPLGHRRALVIAIEVLRASIRSLNIGQATRHRAADALEDFLDAIRRADQSQSENQRRRKQKSACLRARQESRSQKLEAIQCPDCHIGTLGEVNSRLVCDTCGWS